MTIALTRPALTLTRYAGCGHTGRGNDSDRPMKSATFIRVAEVRRAPTATDARKCPGCAGPAR